MMAYPILAAMDSTKVSYGQVYFSTEDKRLKAIAREYNAKVIDRPKELATDEALGEDVFVHAYEWVKMNNKYIGKWEIKDADLFPEKTKIEFVVLMFANAPCIMSWMLDEMVEQLSGAVGADSICTVSKYNMFSPIRMRRYVTSICLDGRCGCGGGRYKENIKSYVEGIQDKGTCDRDSVEDAYIYDCSCAVVRPKCLENIKYGLLPQRWLGRNILGYKQEDPALDVDYEWQMGQIKWWLDRNWIYSL
jgi:hypothetical protein